MSNSISLIAILSLFTLLPFIIASGTYFIKFSIVFVIVRNALGLQQVPSNMTLNGWICPYISRHLLSLNPLLACCRRYSR
ncbi:hypothetical protein AB7130_06105, partial [Escherichia coli]